MGDPFSAAAGAVSFVSLGIQVCQGLVSYCNALKSRDRDIRDASEKLDGLQRTLETLRDVLPKVDGPNLSASPVLQNLSSQILSCDKGLRKLQAALTKFQSAGVPLDFRQSLQKLKQKSLYPLRKNVMQELQSTVAGMQANLDSAVLVHGLYVQNQQDKTLAILKDVSLDTSTSVKDVQAQLQLTNHNPNMLSNINDQVTHLSGTMETTVVHKIEHIGRQVEQLLRVGVPQHNDEMQQIGHNLARMHLGMIERPGLLRSVIDERRQHDRHYICPRQTRQHCMCRLQTSYKYPHAYQSWQPHGRSASRLLIAFAFSSQRDHHQNCPLYNERAKEHILGLNVSYCGAFLAATVKASLSMTQGAGGFSISPCLSFSPVVASNAPAFRLFKNTSLRRLGSAETTQDYLDMRIQQLSRLYSERRASPHDTDLDGDTLLHLAEYFPTIAEPRTPIPSRSIPVPAEASRTRDSTQQGQQQRRVSIQVVRSIMRIDSMWAHVSLLTWLNLKMQDLGAELPQITRQIRWRWRTDFYISTNGPKLLPECAKFLGMAEAVGCNDISLAVLAQSERDLDQEIKRAPHRISEPNVFGQTPLHLCAAWPKGIRILIGAKADVDTPDEYGHTPIEYAALLHVHESMRLLVEADCRLNGTFLDHLMMVETVAGYRESQVKSTVDLVISILSERLGKLQNLATTSLTQFSIEELKLVPNRLIDSEACRVIAMLDEIKVPVPQSLRSACLIGESFYHCEALNARQAEILWQTGFRDVNGLNSFGMSPLMIRRLRTITPEGGQLEECLRLIAWFLSKGANAHQLQRYAFQENKNTEAWRRPNRWLRRDLKSSVTAVHYLGEQLGDVCFFNEFPRYYHFCEGWFSSERQLCSLSDRSIQLLQEIWVDPVRDSCRCACSSSGCLAFTHTIKGVARQVRNLRMYVAQKHGRVPNFNVLPRVSNYIYSVATIVDVDHRPDLSWLCSDMCRFHAFEKLKLKHTCCKQHSMGDDPIVELGDEKDREEIRIEQEEQAERLGELVKEFDEKYKETELPFLKFFEEYWRPRMDEVLQEQGKIDEEALRRIGVVLHKDESRPDEDGRDLEELLAMRPHESEISDDEDTNPHSSDISDDEDEDGLDD